MKANELMIGDWVLSLKEDHSGEFGQVIDISHHDTVLLEYHRTNYYTDIENIQPIPITAEILEANGFYKVRGKKLGNSVMPDTWVYEVKDVSIVIALKEGQFADFEIYNDRRYATFTDSLCVSELQHAMRLIGLHDLADNFKIKEGGGQ